MKTLITIFYSLIALTVALQAQRRPPEIGRHLPDAGPNRVEVRFALGEKAVTCNHFSLTGKIDGRVIIKGKFRSGFQLPSQVKDLPRKDALDLDFKCGKHQWHFSKVPETAFSPGCWWVGTDYPPFQEAFQGEGYEDAVWVRYLIVDRSQDIGIARVTPSLNNSSLNTPERTPWLIS